MAMEQKTKFFLSLLILTLFVVLSRSNGLGVFNHLPDFTLVALFIAGVYLRSYIAPVILILTALAVDNYAVFYEGVSANCITPAYTILPLSYLIMYFGGKQVNSLVIMSFRQFTSVVFILVISSASQWLVATVSYYAFTSESWANFGVYALKWAPVELGYFFYQMTVVIVVFSVAKRLVILNRANKNTI